MPQLQAFTNGGPGKSGEVTIDAQEMDGRYQSADYYTHTDQTRAFQQVHLTAGVPALAGASCAGGAQWNSPFGHPVASNIQHLFAK